MHDAHFHFMLPVWPNPKGPVHEALKQSDGLLPGTDVYDAYSLSARAIRWKYLDDGNGVDSQPTFLGSGNRVRNAYPLFHSRTIYEGQRAANPDKRVVNLTRSSYPSQQRYGAGPGRETWGETGKASGGKFPPASTTASPGSPTE